MKQIYQNHLREIKEHRKLHVPDKKLIQFNANKNPEIYLNLERKLDSRTKIRKKPSVSLAHHRLSRKKQRDKEGMNFCHVKEIDLPADNDLRMQLETTTPQEANTSNVGNTHLNLTEEHSLVRNIEEDGEGTPPEQNYQYLFDEAKYVDNGSINLVSSHKHTPFNELSKSNEDLNPITHPVRSLI